MALTPNDVLNKQFATTRLKEGYDQDEVDDFLDEVLAEFQRLIGENENLKTQLAAAPAAAAPAGDSGEAESLREQLAAAQHQVQELQTQLEQAKEQSGALDGMGSAEYLQLARRVHEEHVREGVVKRDQLIAEGEEQSKTLAAEAQAKSESVVVAAQNRASSLVNEAQAAANAIANEAQEKAAALVAEAQRRYDSQVVELSQEVSTLTGRKSELDRAVAELQDFERNYRASLRSYLETQLGELAGVGAVATGSVPTSTESTGDATTGQQPSVEAPEPPVPGLGGDTGEQPGAPRFGD